MLTAAHHATGWGGFRANGELAVVIESWLRSLLEPRAQLSAASSGSLIGNPLLTRCVVSLRPQPEASNLVS